MKSTHNIHPLEERSVSHRRILMHQKKSRPKKRIPFAEMCLIAGVLAGFFVITGTAMVIFHYVFETHENFHSVAEQFKIQADIIGFVFLGLGVLIPFCAWVAYVVMRALAIVDMANKYQENQGLCAHEETRQSLRSRPVDMVDEGVQVISFKYLESKTDMP